MAIREIVKYGDPRLLAPNPGVSDFDDPSLASLVEDLKQTCWAAPGLGLAAPQIGVNRHVAIVDLSVGKDPSQVVVLVNPRVVDAQGTVRDEEGCLSLEGVRKTKRYQNIEIEYYDWNWKKQRQKFTGWPAQICQHEMDHLEGILI